MKTFPIRVPGGRLWIPVLALLAASLACNFGRSMETTPTPDPAVNTLDTTGLPATSPSQGVAGPTAQPSGPLDSMQEIDRQLLARATVLIIMADIENGEFVPFGIGSGTIISPDGLILTNAHVASPASGNFGPDPDVLIVALNESEDRAPVPSFLAEVRAMDGFLDLAVIQIVSRLDGSRLDTRSLALGYVQVGNSDDMHLGDHINIFGFPGIGGETITFTRGSVSGFASQEQVGDRAWIKTDATIAGGNSGGLGANEQGEIIGVPTRAGTGEAEFTDCRVLQDTNGDGRIDQNDTCIPIGGFINSLRPINFAKPLIRAAQTGVAYESPFRVPGAGGPAPGSGSESIRLIGWSEQIDDNSCPLTPVTSFSPDVTMVSAVFEYSGMTDGQDFAYFWLIDEEVVFDETFAWDFGTSGACFALYIENGGATMPPGNYALLLYAGDGLPLIEEARISVGVEPPMSGQVIVSGVITDADTGRPIPGAIIAALNPGVDVDQWLESGSDADVWQFFEVGEDGAFRFPTPFDRGIEYPVVAGAEGYQLVDGFLVFDESDPQLFELDIELGR